MELDGKSITAQKVIDKYLGRDKRSVIMLLDLFRELSGNSMTLGTVERYKTSYKHTVAFIESTY